MTDVYNPWSVTNYLDKGKFDTYWANSSGNGLVEKMLQGKTVALITDAGMPGISDPGELADALRSKSLKLVSEATGAEVLP